ncbi:MAG: bifunctional nuclease family protein [Tannerella sp.]|jgi:bifunctional DNase/RNase|nr:bifunctional nuclease family protein [Tannerella sp.]
MNSKKVKLRITGLTNSQIQSGAYALVLSEDGPRRLPVIIGMFEAQSIALAVEGVSTPRPMTHDLFLTFLKATGFTLNEIFIYKFLDGVFYSEISISDNEKTIRIDARTSDAIAIALRADCSIFTTESIMKQCGIEVDENSLAEEDYDSLPEELTADDLKDLTKLKKQLKKLEEAEIEERMAKAVEKEDYEFAKVYKDELIRRQSSKSKKK